LGASDRRKPWDERRKGQRRAEAERRRGTDRRHEQARVDADRRRGGGDRRQRQRRTGADRRTAGGWEPVVLDTAADPADPAIEAVLVEAAQVARERAHAPFSHFKVGAALETAAGDIITGCNVENATYGLTMCAERVAIFKAVSEGHRAFTRVVVVADTESPTPPCGACRQLLWEFCGDVDVVLANLDGVTGRCRLASLLPLPFDARLLE
jgi:cytidine deaminase